jgi:hypothetical protein
MEAIASIGLADEQSGSYQSFEFGAVPTQRDLLALVGTATVTPTTFVEERTVYLPSEAQSVDRDTDFDAERAVIVYDASLNGGIWRLDDSDDLDYVIEWIDTTLEAAGREGEYVIGQELALDALD